MRSYQIRRSYYFDAILLFISFYLVTPIHLYPNYDSRYRLLGDGVKCGFITVFMSKQGFQLRRAREEFLLSYIEIMRQEMRQMSSSYTFPELERLSRLQSSLYQHLTDNLGPFLNSVSEPTLKNCFSVLGRFDKRINSLKSKAGYQCNL